MKQLVFFMIVLLAMPVASAYWSFSSSGAIGGPFFAQYTDSRSSLYYGSGATQRYFGYRGPNGNSFGLNAQRDIIVSNNYYPNQNNNHRSVSYGSWNVRNAYVRFPGAVRGGISRYGKYYSGGVNLGRSRPHYNYGQYYSSGSNRGYGNYADTYRSAYIR